ncbi:MAG: beta-ketoacyl synthase N-terminal-like domain-containing protein [Bacteroidota bacterium]
MSNKTSIGIVAWGSSSALGGSAPEIWAQYQHPQSNLGLAATLENNWAGMVSAAEEERISQLRLQQKNYRRLDRSVLLGMLAAERAWLNSGWTTLSGTGLYLGSSRGATGSWEAYFEAFQSEAGNLPPQASPLSTAGNLATHTAQHLGIHGFSSDNSITCSSALHALANAMVWLESGRYDRFLAGGTEAPLTPFTLAQMQALKIYAAAETEGPYPNRSLQLDKNNNTMILGEGSAVFALERSPEKPLAWIKGLGYAREDISSLTGVSKTGIALQTAMRQALREAELSTVDAIVCHCPGTRIGDLSEYAAIRTIFGENIPSLTSNKWKIGHTLGASGGLSLEMALLMLKHQTFVPVPYLTLSNSLTKIRRVMINALGFGGNAISIILEQP